MLRFRYEVESLAALIRSAVDENTPNGQLEPGRVVAREDGKGYYVYIGVRRYFALKALYEETREEKFAVFNAYVDASKSLLELFVRARKENEEGKGERLGLSVLEQVFGLFMIRDSVSPEELDSGLKREFAVAEKLSDEKVRKLFEMEVASHFRFKLGHLERLCTIEDEKEFYLSAACAAGYAVSAERMEKAVDGRDAAYTLVWFKSVFPDYKEGPEKRPITARPEAAKGSEEGGRKGEAPPNQEPLEVHEKEVIILPCPACGAENMVQLRLKAEVTRLPGDPNGESVTATPDAVVRCDCGCSHCLKEFHVFIEPLGGRRYGVEASLSRKFREPKDVVEAVDLRVDFQENAWQKIVEGKVGGVVRAHIRTKKGG
jgi:hypothetical protein